MKRKPIIISSICVILLLALVGGTFAWFYVNEEVTVSYGNSVFCEAGDSLEIALVENGRPGRWSNSIDYSDVNDFTIVDISGDGYNLYRPESVDDNQQPVWPKTLVESDSKDFVEMEVAFRSISKLNVYLSAESFIDPVDVTKTGNIYGEFSKDYIAGAMRVAVIEGDEVKMIWAPNPQYELIQYSDGRYSLEPNSQKKEPYRYYAVNTEGKLEEKDVPADWFASKKFVVDGTGANKDWTGGSPVLLSLDPATYDPQEGKSVKIRIWFEGTDREAHQALAGGNVKVQLKFVGVAKDENTAAQSVIDDLDSANFTVLPDGMVCSVDGLVWQNALPDNLESGSTIFVKYPETEEYYETSCKAITIN